LAELKKRIELEWQARQREVEMATLRQRHSERLLSIASLIGPGTPKRKLRALLAEAGAIAASHAADPELLEIANRVRGAIEAALAALRKPIPWMPIGVGAAMAVVGLAIILLVPKLFENKVQPVLLVPVEIRTNPPGASVHLGDRFCVTPHCRFDLPPGRYLASAELKDYQPLQQTLMAVAGKPNVLVELTLQPLPTPVPAPVENAKTPAPPPQQAKTVEDASKLRATDSSKKTNDNTTPSVVAPAPKSTAENKRPAELEIPPKVLEAPPSIVTAPTPSTPIVALPPAAGTPPPPAQTAKPQPVPDPKSLVKDAVKLGIALTEQDRWKEAIESFGKALQIDPNSADAYYNRAGTRYHLGQYKDAIADYEKTLVLQPNYPNASKYLKYAQLRWKKRAYIVGEEIEAPTPQPGNVYPSYPRAARDAGKQGVVKLECVIETDGVPTDCWVTKSLDRELDNSAIKAVGQWRFNPALRKGQKVPVVVPLEVPFKLPR